MANVPGVTVTANVELEREMTSKKVETKVDPKTVPIMQKTEENTLSQKSGRGPGGAPGLGGRSNPVRISLHRYPVPAAAMKRKTRARRRKRLHGLEFDDGKNRTRRAHAQTYDRRHRYSEADYFEQVWQQRNPAADGAEKKKPDAVR